MENENRLIDTNGFKSAFYVKTKEGDNEILLCHGKVFVAFDVVQRAIENAPTVDAVEVVHAYWTGSRFNPMTDEYEEYCSHCCAWSSEYGKPYCPNRRKENDYGERNGLRLLRRYEMQKV